MRFPVSVKSSPTIPTAREKNLWYPGYRNFSRKFKCRVMPGRVMNSAISFLSVIHKEKISSMNLFHSRGLVLLRFSISVSTADRKVTPSDLPSYFEL